MSRDIHVYAIAHDQPDGHFLVREKGRPDHRLAIPKDMSVFDTLKKIAAAHGADSMHIHLTNDLTVPAQVGNHRHYSIGRNEAGSDADFELRPASRGTGLARALAPISRHMTARKSRTHQRAS
jgi:hypothetical protein